MHSSTSLSVNLFKEDLETLEWSIDFLVKTCDVPEKKKSKLKESLEYAVYAVERRDSKDVATWLGILADELSNLFDVVARKCQREKA